MAVELRLPNITADTAAGQLAQIRSYLYQFAEELNWALNTVSSPQENSTTIVREASPVIEAEQKSQDAFDQIKSLIIKSADIVESYYEKIDGLLSLSGKYAATADFGEDGVAGYIEETRASIDATSTYVRQNFYSKEEIDGIVDEIRESSGYIKTGMVGTSIGANPNDKEIGIEIGNFTSSDETQHKRYARYTAAGMELFDGSVSDTPVAYVSQRKLYITSAEFISDVKMGKYKMELDNGIAFRWEG